MARASISLLTRLSFRLSWKTFRALTNPYREALTASKRRLTVGPPAGNPAIKPRRARLVHVVISGVAAAPLHAAHSPRVWGMLPPAWRGP